LQTVFGDFDDSNIFHTSGFFLFQFPLLPSGYPHRKFLFYDCNYCYCSHHLHFISTFHQGAKNFTISLFDISYGDLQFHPIFCKCLNFVFTYSIVYIFLKIYFVLKKGKFSFYLLFFPFYLQCPFFFFIFHFIVVVLGGDTLHHL
jgi:hypothetical protein